MNCTCGLSPPGPGGDRDPGQGGDRAGDGPRRGEDPLGAHALGQRRFLVERGRPHGQTERGEAEEGEERRQHDQGEPDGPEVGDRMKTSPTWIVSTPHGSPRLWASKPQMSVTTSWMMKSIPMVIMISANGGRPTMRRRINRSTTRPTERGDGHGQHHGRHERQAPRGAEVVGEVGADHHEAALGEVDDAGGLEDDHEARGPPAAYLEPEGDAAHDELQELGHVAPPWYIDSINELNSSVMALRLTFCVAVTSPSSWSSSLGSRRNALMVSTWARSALASATALAMSSTTSALEVRSA